MVDQSVGGLHGVHGGWIYLFFFEREKERLHKYGRGRGGEKEREAEKERISSSLQAQHGEEKDTVFHKNNFWFPPQLFLSSVSESLLVWQR